MRHAIASVVFFALPALAQQASLNALHGNRPFVDAHNCYPYEGQWTDRLIVVGWEF